MSLSGILEAYVLTGIVGNFAYDKVRNIFSSVIQKGPVEIFLEAIQETVEEHRKQLEHFTRDGAVYFHLDKLHSLINSSIAKELPLTPTYEAGLLGELVQIFCQHQILEIGGHQLSDEQYTSKVKDILAHSKHRFRRKISQYQDAFNEVMLAGFEEQSSRLVEIQKHTSEIPNLTNEFRELRETISQSAQAKQLVQVIAPQTIQPQKAAPLYETENEVDSPRNSIYETVSLDSLFSVDYLSPLQVEVENKGFFNRPHIIESVRNLLAKWKIVGLLGEPGIGKTFLLSYIGGDRLASYVSLKGKTSFQIFSYLANRIRIIRGERPIRLQTEDEAKWQLENELRNTPILLLIDDVEHNPDISRKILSLEISKAQILLATRSTHAVGDYVVHFCSVPSFTEEEISSFLLCKGLNISQDKVKELQKASNGNPLYLYYFSIEQIDPLPQGLQAYQEAIWRGLSATDKEILILLSLSLFPRNPEELHFALKLLNSTISNFVEAVEYLNRSQPIVNLWC